MDPHRARRTTLYDWGIAAGVRLDQPGFKPPFAADAQSEQDQEIASHCATLSDVLGPVAAIFSLLLMLTGIAKIRRPADTARALTTIGVPFRVWLGSALGVLELSVGALALATLSESGFLAQAVLYAGFTLWITIALLKDVPIASCGCLGTPDTPPYWGHLVVDITAVVSSLGAAMIGGIAYPKTPLEGLATIAVLTVATYLCWALIGDGARLYGATSS